MPSSRLFASSAWGLVLVGFLSTVMAASAAAPLKALIVDGQNNHKWEETTPVLARLLEETGRFTVDVATAPAAGQDVSGFRPAFAAYDVIVSNYNGADWSDQTRDDLEAYVAGGGGLVIYHAADNSFPTWPAYNAMIGLGGWGKRDESAGPYVYYKDGALVRDPSPGRGGSHGPQKPFLIVVREPSHPITRGLPGSFMHAADELYSQLRGPAENLKVLASAYADPSNRGTGRDEPMLMTIDYGKGRVFHTTLGHGQAQLRSVAFITTFVRGAEWVATGAVTLPVPADFPGPEEPSIRD